jgi:hypothetical protein
VTKLEDLHLFKKKKHYNYLEPIWRAERWYWGYAVEYNYFRTPRTMQRMRYECGVRDDRDGLNYEPPTNIPDAWDDRGPKPYRWKSWKRVSRCRKQWMVHLKR